MIKGFTVHLAVNGKSACGARPRGFAGHSGLTMNIRRVTCRKCETVAQVTADAAACEFCGEGPATCPDEYEFACAGKRGAMVDRARGE